MSAAAAIPDSAAMPAQAPRLSICIATFKRGAFIGETLASILPTLPEGVEVLVLDGASPDNTAEVVTDWALRHGHLRYIRAETNSGVDQDYDKAVSYARGDYCWLMTDDDLLRPDAVARVLAACADDPDLVVVNSDVEDHGLERLLATRLPALHPAGTRRAALPRPNPGTQPQPEECRAGAARASETATVFRWQTTSCRAG